MKEPSDFAEKAREVEALASSTENPLLRMTLRILAQDYRVLAEQENSASGPNTCLQPEVTLRKKAVGSGAGTNKQKFP